jgi:hypothetical protein
VALDPGHGRTVGCRNRIAEPGGARPDQDDLALKGQRGDPAEQRIGKADPLERAGRIIIDEPPHAAISRQVQGGKVDTYSEIDNHLGLRNSEEDAHRLESKRREIRTRVAQNRIVVPIGAGIVGHHGRMRRQTFGSEGLDRQSQSRSSGQMIGLYPAHTVVCRSDESARQNGGRVLRDPAGLEVDAERHDHRPVFTDCST